MASSKFLNPITLLAVRKFSIGGRNDDAPVANTTFSYGKSSPLSSLSFFSFVSMPVTSTPFIHLISYFLKNSPGEKSKSSISRRPSKKWCKIQREYTYSSFDTNMISISLFISLKVLAAFIPAAEAPTTTYAILWFHLL